MIIPVKNGSNYLREAIQSLAGQDVPVEIIVVNDGSTDDTAEIAASLGCKVLSHPESKGQVAAKNTGIKEASGDYVLFLDHDDVMREGALKAMYDEIESDREVSAGQAMVKDFFVSGDRIDAWHGYPPGALLWAFHGSYPHPQVGL